MTKINTSIGDTKPFRMRADASTGRAAFCQFYCPGTDRYLWLKRSETGDAPNLWAGPGGGVEEGETELEGLLRELDEEIGFTDPIDPKLFCQYEKPGFTAYNYIASVPEEFEPQLNHEHTDFVWSKEPPQPLHPALEDAMRDPRFADHTDELNITAASTIDDDNPFPVVADYDVDSGVTWDAFKSWSGSMKRKYLGEHPTSTFYEKMGKHSPEDQKKVDEHKKGTAEKKKPFEEKRAALDKAIRKERDPAKRKKLEDEREQHHQAIEKLDNDHDDFKDSLHQAHRERRAREKANPNGGLIQRRKQMVTISNAIKALRKKVKHYAAQYERGKKGKTVRTHGNDTWDEVDPTQEEKGIITLKVIRNHVDKLNKQIRQLQIKYERLRDDVDSGEK